MSFADKLIKLRKDKRISQEELAAMLDVSRQAISRWEMGSTLLDINNIIKLSDIFGVSIDSLVRDDLDLENKERKLLDRFSNKGDVALISSPILIFLGLYMCDTYENLLLNKICNLLGIICTILGGISFILVFYFYNEGK